MFSNLLQVKCKIKKLTSKLKKKNSLSCYLERDKKNYLKYYFEN